MNTFGFLIGRPYRVVVGDASNAGIGAGAGGAFEEAGIPTGNGTIDAEFEIGRRELVTKGRG